VIQLCTSDTSTAYTAQQCCRMLQLSLQKLTAKTIKPVSQMKHNSAQLHDTPHCEAAQIPCSRHWLK